MRHGKKLNHLGRTNTHRKAMMANMASSLIKHKRISTTLAKAKALRTYIEPLITKAKNDTTHSRRTIFAYLQDKEVVTILFREIAEKVATRPGGYTRIIKLNNRLGDNAEMALIELVDYNTVYGNTLEEKKTTRRSRRRGGKTSGEVEPNNSDAALTPADTDTSNEQVSVASLAETATPEVNTMPEVADTTARPDSELQAEQPASFESTDVEAPEVESTDKTFENETTPEAAAATPQQDVASSAQGHDGETSQA